MKQLGRVIAEENGAFRVSVVRETACGESCASCSAKCTFKNQVITAARRDGVHIGDLVVFEMSTGKVLTAAFLVYIMPLIVFAAVYMILYYCGSGEYKAIISSAVAACLWFAIMHFIDKKLKVLFNHTIVSVLDEQADEKGSC